ncbi:MAG TPA: hypothetical protein VG755_16325 [Nannocystaceae bacterium]|nr:hypothetical protein [Nannocystaceae bacterium]
MSTKERVSDLAIERLALGELAPDEAKRVRAALGDDADAKLAALAKEDAEILAAAPPAMVAAEVKRRLARTEAKPASPAPRWWIPMLAVATTGGLAWWISRPLTPDHIDVSRGPGPTAEEIRVGGDEPPEVLRIKGEPAMVIDRLAERGTERLGDGDVAKTGDRLQVQYRAGDREEGAIVSIDGRGVATLHFPADENATAVMRTGGMIPLDHSYELDDAPGFERFFLVTTTPGQRLHVDVVMAAARTLASSPTAAKGELALPRGYEQKTLSLRKQ